jgi:hypothetical protein
MAVGAFNTPFTSPAQIAPWGASPQGWQGLGINPYAFQQYMQNQPLLSAPLSSAIAGPALGVQPVQQVLSLLQTVPQQLQHLQQLVAVQLQELQQLQHIIQLVPGQLQQVQQLIQAVSQQVQQPAQFQPFGQSVGLGGVASTPLWGLGPQAYGAFGAQPSHVM